jgi:NAD(P)H-dependent FMN reductase/catechol 2,3-dioxygenase-like lactoylglutathione lyase family enzyme
MHAGIRILGISGSLRTTSTNTTLLQAAAKVAPKEVEIALYDRLADLPHFSPDLEEPEAVVNFRQQLESSDAVFVSTPEYAHGVPGVLKNALDWLVGSLELTGKPIGLLNASARSTYAQASLKETLTIMSAHLIPDACVTIPLLGKSTPAATIAADPEMAGLLRSAIEALVGAINPTAAERNSQPALNRYVDSTEQLVTEIVVRNIHRSVDFYRSLGFALLRDAGDFVELTWEDHRLFLAEASAFAGTAAAGLEEIPGFPLANVRVMVHRVDDLWNRAMAVGAKVVIPIGDRYYGLRDFTIADPDGFGIRFASLHR